MYFESSDNHQLLILGIFDVFFTQSNYAHSSVSTNSGKLVAHIIYFTNSNKFGIMKHITTVIL